VSHLLICKYPFYYYLNTFLEKSWWNMSQKRRHAFLYTWYHSHFDCNYCKQLISTPSMLTTSLKSEVVVHYCVMLTWNDTVIYFTCYVKELEYISCHNTFIYLYNLFYFFAKEWNREQVWSGKLWKCFIDGIFLTMIYLFCMILFFLA
jgi:hypothetical protein